MNQLSSQIILFKETLLNLPDMKRVKNSQYRYRLCPKCGDFNFHLYLKIDMMSDDPVLFHCFKCNSSGIVDDDFIQKMGIDNLTVPKWKAKKKLTSVSSTVEIKAPDQFLNENDNVNGICSYINERVGHYPSIEELNIFRYISHPDRYASEYLGGLDSKYNPRFGTYGKDVSVFKRRHWFQMTNGNIIGRYYDDNTNMRWLKYNAKRDLGVGMYKLAVPVDLCQVINVMIAEGPMDVIGLYYNCKSFENCIYIAVCGKDYQKGIDYVINKGIFGNSVNINIFKDSDVDVRSIYIDKYKMRLFRNIDIYENTMEKDCGVLPDKLMISKIKSYNKRR